jgi:hypothetical protein
MAYANPKQVQPNRLSERQAAAQRFLAAVGQRIWIR